MAGDAGPHADEGVDAAATIWFMRATGPILTIAGGTLLSACAAAGVGVDAVGVDRPAPFPECGTGPYAFVGRSTLAAIGISSTGEAEAGRTGTIWVTAEPVDPDLVGQPMAPGEPVAPPARWVCVEWPDGSGMAMPIDDGWEPPGSVLGAEGSSDPAPPIGALALAVGALAVIAVSWLAFRREASPSP